jgi:endoglucanase
MIGRRMVGAAVVCIVAATFAISAVGSNAQGNVPNECSASNFPATRDPSNPLDLPNPPGADPLTGASFYVNGPAHGDAAGAIAKLLGRSPSSFPDSESWSDFDSTFVPKALAKHPGAAHKVHELEKIAAEPVAVRFSEFTGGGVPGAILSEAHKIFCSNMQADPDSIPIFQTLFALPHGHYCASNGALQANEGTFKREVNEMAQGTGRRPVVFLLELDGIGTSACLHGGALSTWEGQIRYEINALSALPHTVVYMEGGYSDANSARYTARILNAVGVNNIRGFYTNDTHLNWTIDEVNWAHKISTMTGGAHFIVNTAENGRGPLRPHNRHKHGNEVLCNPSGRGLGPQPTSNTGFFNLGADAWMWSNEPGHSSGHCNGGPAAGTFWVKRAVGLGKRANGQLGPGYPSRPY